MKFWKVFTKNYFVKNTEKHYQGKKKNFMKTAEITKFDFNDTFLIISTYFNRLMQPAT